MLSADAGVVFPGKDSVPKLGCVLVVPAFRAMVIRLVLAASLGSR